MIWALRWSVALRTFYRQILSLLYSSFPFGNFRPRLVRALLVYIIHIQQSNVVLLHFQFLEALAMPHPSQLLPIGSEHWVGASTPPPMVKSCYSWYPPRRYERVGVGDGQSVQSCALKVFEKLGKINIQHFRSVIALSLHPLPSLN